MPNRTESRKPLKTHGSEPVAQNGLGGWGLGAGGLGFQSCTISGPQYSASGGRGPAGCGAAANNS